MIIKNRERPVHLNCSHKFLKMGVKKIEFLYAVMRDNLYKPVQTSGVGDVFGVFRNTVKFCTQVVNIVCSKTLQ